MSAGAKALPKKGKKEETLVEKLATLGRRRKIKEAEEAQNLVQEGLTAIESPDRPVNPELPASEYILDENEERSMVEPISRDDPRLKELMHVLIEWINDVLLADRILVKDLEEDLYDGQVLGKMIENLANICLDVAEVTQTEGGQKEKLHTVLHAINQILNISSYSEPKWSVEAIHNKNLVATLHILVALAVHFNVPIKMPPNVALNVVVVRKKDGLLKTTTITEIITDDFHKYPSGLCNTVDGLPPKVPPQRDAFDTLFDHAPEKLAIVQKSLLTFAAKHMSQLGYEVVNLHEQFHDGVYFILLLGILEGYFVPLYAYNMKPKTIEEKVHNIKFVYELIQEAGLPKPKPMPEDIVSGDLKSILRVLYSLFTKYKNV